MFQWVNVLENSFGRDWKKTRKNPDRIQKWITFRCTQRSLVVVERSTCRHILTSRIFYTLKTEAVVSSKKDMYLNKVHGVISQKTLNLTLNLTLEGPCIIFCNIYTFQRDKQCCSTDCLLVLRCQLYMFRTVTVHPQELLFLDAVCADYGMS